MVKNILLWETHENVCLHVSSEIFHQQTH